MIDQTIILLPFLYAETHYRFRYFFSFLRKHEPEILADAPHRIEPHSPIPLMILSKDAHRYPCTLHRLQVTLSKDEKPLRRETLVEGPLDLREEWWWRVFFLQTEGLSGWVQLDVTMEIEVGRKRRIYHNDNYRTSSRRPLSVFVATEPLPRFPGLHFGDCHTHSTYTNDQVEYGSPLAASVALCKSMGHSFFCVTDHSYDLDDRLDNYLVNDPTLPKWKVFQDEVNSLNNHQRDFAIVRGEEITCRNHREDNVHLVLLGNRRFFPGSGDSAERWLRTRSEMSIQEVLTQFEDGCVPIGAHPCEPVPMLQQLLLGRGQWSIDDLQHERLVGLQFANGAHDTGFREGLAMWIRLLLRGRRLFVYAGNDAHGNFNRFRQLKIPFVALQERDKQLFGKFRTGVFLNEPISERAILNALSLGRCIITDGPVLNVRLLHDSEITRIGSTLSLRHARAIEISFRSTREFGTLDRLTVVRGWVGADSEEVFYHVRGLRDQITLVTQLKLAHDDKRAFYLRAEAWTDGQSASDQKHHCALTNPLWFVPE